MHVVQSAVPMPLCTTVTDAPLVAPTSVMIIVISHDVLLPAIGSDKESRDYKQLKVTVGVKNGTASQTWLLDKMLK